MGLGFTGWYQTQPEYLRKKMLELSQRIRGVLEPDPTARICPEDYLADTRDLREAPTGRVWLMVVIFTVCVLTAFFGSWYLFREASRELKESLQVILKQEPFVGKTAADAPAPTPVK
jgi:type VI protein secretion system component VasF